MPAIVTHHLFASQVYDKLRIVIGVGEVERQAFLLGNIGPDPLFCMKLLPKKLPFRNLGTTMHRQDPARLLTAFHASFIKNTSGKHQGACKAFALGFLCHYLLDSTVHPLVNAQKCAYCAAGGNDLPIKLVGGSVHALIETELDEYLLTKTLGVSVKSFVASKEILICPDQELSVISRRFAKGATQAYEYRVPDWLYLSSVRAYRTAQHALDSKRNGLRSHIDYAQLVGKHYLHVQALSHNASLRSETPFANDDHLPFPHPYEEGKVVDDSFDDLYQRAFTRALDAVPRYVQTSFSAVDCAVLSDGINFSGKRVEHA